MNDLDEADGAARTRYFFHIRNGSGSTRDDEGQLLHPGQTPRQIAIAGARSVMAADVLQGALDLNGLVEVTDVSGQSVLILPFRDVLTII